MALLFENEKDVPKLDLKNADKMLGYIFEEAKVEPNTVPMSELESYSNYRMERYTLQRAVLILAMAIFIALPLMFVLPNFSVSPKTESVRGLPEYEIKVTTFFNVKKVTAVIGNETLPVYEVDGHTYTVEPIQNGTMTVTVELFNGQRASEKVSVNSVDNLAPEITSSLIAGNDVTLYLNDKGIGVDYDNIYAYRNDEKIYPDEINEKDGYVLFNDMEAGDAIYIFDYLENTLVVRISRQE
ncbi:MAG: hypothetical protein K6E13_06525 [Lachnospiraceae bacterium]|nr:hypothetical protein [Lachnospiraceae bacterium]